MSDGAHRYLVALGGNVRHVRHGPPEKVLNAAIAALAAGDVRVLATSPITSSRPIGPSLRTYANGAVLIETDLEPPALLNRLKQLERAFGRAARGQRWSARTLDCDIVLWSGGAWAEHNLVIPHPEFRVREFVLGPITRIAPAWRDPVTGRTIRQLLYRLRAQGA